MNIISSFAISEPHALFAINLEYSPFFYDRYNYNYRNDKIKLY